MASATRRTLAIGCPELITEYKVPARRRNQPPPPPLTPQQLEFNRTIQHYRARVEHLISEVVFKRAALNLGGAARSRRLLQS